MNYFNSHLPLTVQKGLFSCERTNNSGFIVCNGYSKNCSKSCFRLDYPVRAVSFSYDGALLAAGSEDHFIDIANVQTGERLFLSLNNSVSERVE